MAHAAPATARAAALADSAPAPTVDEGVARVQEARTQAYTQVLAQYDAAVAAAPEDVSLAVERCRFMWQFTDEDYDWVERAPDDLEQCLAGIDKRWPEEPRVRLFDLDMLYGEEAIERGNAWLDDAKAWPPELRRELYAKLSRSYRWVGIPPQHVARRHLMQVNW